MNKLTDSPWGEIQHQKEHGPGIVTVSTAGHGGVWLSPERRAALPEILKAAPLFSRSPGWYEEDCDAILPVIAFPEFFSGQACYFAVRMARDGGDYPLYVTCRQFLADGSAPVLSKAEAFAAAERVGEKWERGSFSGDRKGWQVNFQRGEQSRRVTMQDYPAKVFYTDTELDALNLAG